MDTKPPTFEEALRDAMPIADTTAVREAHARDVEKARLEELKACEKIALEAGVSYLQCSPGRQVSREIADAILARSEVPRG